MTREQAVREKRAQKQEKKAEKKLAAAELASGTASPEVDDTTAPAESPDSETPPD